MSHGESADDRDEIAVSAKSVGVGGSALGLGAGVPPEREPQSDYRADVVTHDVLEGPLNHGGDGH